MVYKNFSCNLHIVSGFSFLPPGESSPSKAARGKLGHSVQVGTLFRNVRLRRNAVL